MTGLSIAAVLLALAVLVRPRTTPAVARLTALRPPNEQTRRRLAKPLPILVGAAVGLLPVAAGCGLPGLVLGPPLGCLGFVGARWLVRWTELRRARAPNALLLASGWDLLAACLRGGMSAEAAVRTIAGEMPDPAAGMLRHTAELLRLGSDPVAAWAPALAEPCTAELARGARRSARSGAGLAAVAAGLAAAVRAGADDAAEARAQRAAVGVAGPLGLCFLPAFLCVGIAPVVIGLATTLLASW